MKLIKLSVAAALSVACISSVNAKDLAEAIKNVDVSGTVVYRYNDYEDGANTAEASNNYKIATSLKSKVNDDISMSARTIIGDGTTNPVSIKTGSADSEAKFALSEVNFSYTGLENATVTVGKQGIATPFTVARDSIGGESTGTGIVATYSINPITIAAAYFNNSNINVNGNSNLSLDGSNISTIGLMGSFAGINADAWYIEAKDTASAYTVGLNSSYDVASLKLNPSVRYSEQDDNANNNEISTFKIDLGLTAGIFDAYLGYGKSGKDGGVALDGYSSATTFDQHWRVGLLTQADSEILFANVGAKITDKVHVALKHSNLDAEAAGNDEQETYVQAVYNMSSNFVTYVRLGEYKKENSQASNGGRLHVQYSF